MKKTEIYVPIANKKEAKRAKAVLEAMGEKIKPNYWFDDKPSSDQVQLVCNKDGWMVAINWDKTKITLKQLIELLVIEKREKELEENANKLMREMAVQRCDSMRQYRKILYNPNNIIGDCFWEGGVVCEPKKIAVRVDNEKEFNALMKYYDSFGWKWRTKEEPLSVNREEINKNYPVEIEFKDCFLWSGPSVNEGCGFTIVPFQDFAKEHGIKIPLLVSEDGVDLYEDDSVFGVTKLICNEKWMISSSYFFKESSVKYIKLNSDRAKVFSTLEAAEKWVADKNKKTVSKVELYFVGKDGIAVTHTFKELDERILEIALNTLHCRRG